MAGTGWPGALLHMPTEQTRFRYKHDLGLDFSTSLVLRLMLGRLCNPLRQGFELQRTPESRRCTVCCKQWQHSWCTGVQVQPLERGADHCRLDQRDGQNGRQVVCVADLQHVARPFQGLPGQPWTDQPGSCRGASKSR